MNYEEESEYDYRLLNNHTNVVRKRKNKRIKNGAYWILVSLFIFYLSNYLAIKFIFKFETDKEIVSNKLFNSMELFGFVSLYGNGTKGPITVNRDLDNGKKYNIYSMIKKLPGNDLDTFYYNYQEFNGLDEVIKKKDEYLCEIEIPSPYVEAYNLTCPNHYTIAIDKAFYGRYKKDKSNCNVDNEGKEVDKDRIKTKKDCGEDTTSIVKTFCEGNKICFLRPNKFNFPDVCEDIYKYLHVEYHCVKDKEFKKPKFAVVMYADYIQPNSIYENAISEFYQYSDINNYTFILYNKYYDEGRNVFYMKLHVIIEAILRGLKTKEYDWVFWVDSDVVLANPNIKLETFLPTDEKVSFIAAADHHGLNAGVFLIKVNAWSLNFMKRSIAYQYSHKDKKLEFSDQTSMNNVITGDREDEHYVIVPQHWFNIYPNIRKKGDMLLHFAGRHDKKKDSEDTRKELEKEPDYLEAQTNEQLRREVLEFYKKPKSEQGKIWYDDL